MISEATAADSPKRAVWPGCLLGLYAAAAGLTALASWKVCPGGWAVATQPLLGLIGLAGGLLLLCGDPWWRSLLRLWTFAQAVVVVVDPSGELTRQPFLWLAYANVSSTVVDGQLTELQGYGVNLAGALLFVLTQWIMGRRWYLDVPNQRWQFLALRLVRLAFTGGCLLLGGYLAWSWVPVFLAKEPLMVILSPLPGAEVYAQDRRLGSTPLVITPQKMVEWGFSKPGVLPRCQLRPTPLDHGLSLSGNKETATLLLKPPAWCAARFETFPSEWGPRALPLGSRQSSNRCEVQLVGKTQAGLILSLPDGLPSRAASGQSLDFVALLRCNAPDPHLQGAGPLKAGQKAILAVTFVQGGAALTREVALPEAWCKLSPGTEQQQAVKVAAPEKPGKYDVRVQYRLFRDPGGQQRLDHGRARSYGWLEVK
jgi:hypothetical protein